MAVSTFWFLGDIHGYLLKRDEGILNFYEKIKIKNKFFLCTYFLKIIYV